MNILHIQLILPLSSTHFHAQEAHSDRLTALLQLIPLLTLPQSCFISTYIYHLLAYSLPPSTLFCHHYSDYPCPFPPSIFTHAPLLFTHSSPPFLSSTMFSFPFLHPGMSFSKRQSKWANSALVVSVTPEDMKVRTCTHTLKS